jgi:hypothetical protein
VPRTSQFRLSRFRTIAVLGTIAVIAAPIRVGGNYSHFEAVIEFNDQKVVGLHEGKFLGFILHGLSPLYGFNYFFVPSGDQNKDRNGMGASDQVRPCRQPGYVVGLQ